MKSVLAEDMAVRLDIANSINGKMLKSVPMKDTPLLPIAMDLPIFMTFAQVAY